jgi:hypothetical protein
VQTICPIFPGTFGPSVAILAWEAEPEPEVRYSWTHQELLELCREVMGEGWDVKVADD